MKLKTLGASLVALLLLLSQVIAAVADAPTPGWAQVNTSGFGSLHNGVGPLAVHDNKLYAGAWSGTPGQPAQVWRTADGHNWSQFSPGWAADSQSAYDLESFGNYLYAGVDFTSATGGEVWRTDGSTWKRVVQGGFGDANNTGVNAFAVFGGNLYAATTNETAGVQIWRSSTGDAGAWTRVATDGFNQGATGQDVAMESFNGYLYVGLGRTTGPDQFVGELWRSNNGTTWTPVFTDGLGSAANSYVSALAPFHGELYIGIRNLVGGGEVWRSSNGLSWTRVVAGGLGDVNNGRPYGLTVYDDQLLLTFSNTVTGAQVWTSPDGVTWRRLVTGGWGDVNNGYANYFNKGAAVFGNRLFMATLNQATGGEIWLKLTRSLYLPLVRRP